MSFADQFVLWLHIGFAVFTIGPVAVAISSTPRYIRKRDTAILRYLARITAIFTTGSLLVLIFGLVLGQLLHEFSKPWLSAAVTLFAVAVVLLVLIIRDQRKAIRALDEASAEAAASAQAAAGEPGGAAGAEPPPAAEPGQPALLGAPGAAGSGAAAAVHLASVERGRIAVMGGVVNLIWLAVLALMIWQP
jgi:hypothetical protein